MKARALLLLLASLSFLCPPTFASPTDRNRDSVVLGTVTQPNGATIERGTSRMTARRQLGQAHKELSRDVWVYYGYHASSEPATGPRCDTLVVTFHDGKVTDLKIVNASALNVIAASLKPAAQGSVLAKK